MLQCDFQYPCHDFLLQAKFQQQAPIMGIVGPSGSGKSTLLKNIAGILRPVQGQIQLTQRILFDAQRQIHLPAYQRKIALMFQQAALFPHLTVEQNLRFAERWAADWHAQFELRRLIELFDIQALLKRRAGQLSGGEAQRVAMVRALYAAPDLLLLDEPLSGLDSRLKMQILPFLKMIWSELHLPMLYVTHHAEELDFLQADLWQMQQGILTPFAQLN